MLLSLVLPVLCVLYALYHWVIYPAFLSPLARIPNAHPTSCLSAAWILTIRYQGKELGKIHDAHTRLGPVVRLGPNEISVNCVKGGIQTVYAGGFEKHEWYSVFANCGSRNMFSMMSSKQHSVRKRMLSNIYSKSVLQNSFELELISNEIVFNRLNPILDDKARSEDAFDILNLLYRSTFDFVSSYIWGLHTGNSMLEDKAAFDEFFEHYEAKGSQHRYWWTQELPSLTSWLKRLGLQPYPKSTDTAGPAIEAMIAARCASAEQLCVDYNRSDEKDLEAGRPIVYSQLRGSMTKGAGGGLADQAKSLENGLKFDIASELQDHVLAGFETSAILLTYLVHELSKNPSIQDDLRRELRGIGQSFKSEDSTEASNSRLPSAKQLDSLPLLQAVLQETLRLHASIPGPQPRVTPPSCTLGPNGEFTDIPAGVRISAQAWSLHRNEDVFPEAETWKPERWLSKSSDSEDKTEEERRKLMDRWFWAFGNGGRMCVGSHLATYQMKYITFAIYSCYKTQIINDIGIEQMDMYTAPPQSGKLIIKVTAADR